MSVRREEIKRRIHYILLLMAIPLIGRRRLKRESGINYTSDFDISESKQSK